LKYIRRFLADAVPLLECQKILKTKGLSRSTLAQCEPHIQTIASVGVRDGFLAYLRRQFDIATALGLQEIGLPICSDQIESSFGLGKQLGTGEIKDADRIAIRLPALCGTPTRAEAKQVIGISVADQNKITSSLTSLIKLRREVLPNPDRLESLGTDQARAHVELIPDAKNRSKTEEMVDLSRHCQETYDPVPSCQGG
jgi:hypothetical protein